MADDQDKSQQTEEPTAKRLQQARESGDTIKSTEVTAFVLLAGGTLAIAMFGKSTMLGMAQLLTMFLQEPDAMSVDGAGLLALSRGVLAHMALLLAPFFGVMIAASFAGHLVQGLPTFTPDKLMPDFSKVSPMAGFKRMFGLEGWVNLVKGLLKIAIVGIAIWTQLWPERGGLEAILNQTAGAVVGDMTRLLFKVLMASLSALAAIAAAGY